MARSRGCRGRQPHALAGLSNGRNSLSTALSANRAVPSAREVIRTRRTQAALDGAAATHSGESRDREPDVRAYWRECGVTERQLVRTSFMEKDFGFFRGWIDSGVAEDVIVRTAKSLRDRSCWSSSDLAHAELLELGAERGVDDDDPLLLPYGLEQQADRFEGTAWTTCGGGIFQCLLETELWLSSREIEFERGAAVY